MGKADNDPKFVQVRHEEMAAFEAVGYAKFSGRVGVCMATSGPGAIHLLNGLYDATARPRSGRGHRRARPAARPWAVPTNKRSTCQSLFKDVCHQYVQTASVPQQLPNLIDRAFRALSTAPPTCIIIPSDLQELEYEPPPTPSRWSLPAWGSTGPRSRPTTTAPPGGRDPQRRSSGWPSWSAAEHAGHGEEVTEVADRLGAGVAKALLGQGRPGDDLRLVTGSIGLLGTRPSYEMMVDCDTILTVGSSFPYTQFMPEFGQARGVQIDIDGKQIGMRYPYEVNMVADAKSALQPFCRCWSTKVGPVVAGDHRIERGRLVGDRRGPGHERQRQARVRQSAATGLGTQRGIPGNAIVAADSGPPPTGTPDS